MSYTKGAGSEQTNGVDGNARDVENDRLDFSVRSISLNIQNEDGNSIALSDDDSPDGQSSRSNPKISFHLSLDQHTKQSGESRTKKFLESDDAIISQLFTQTISSAGVTPTDDYDEFFATEQQELEVKRKPSSEEDKSEDTAVLTENASRLAILNNQQRPSIVIDCFDETPPVTPDEPTPGTAGAFYFHTTIVDDEDEDETLSNSNQQGSVEVDSEDTENANVEISDELLVQAVEQYGLADNFTTIEESTDDILSPTADDFGEDECKTDLNETSDNAIENKTESSENNQDDSMVNNESAVPFLSNNSNQLVEPEPALHTANILDSPQAGIDACEIDDDNELEVDIESEDDTSVENNVTAKAFSFDEEACIQLFLLFYIIQTF